MDKTITTALLIVISVIMVMSLFNVAYPAVVEGGDAISRMASRAEERLNSRADIIHAAGELDNTGWWSDANGNGRFEVFLWVKNTGLGTINPIDSVDVFFGPEGNFTRIPNENGVAANTFPSWAGTLESGTIWVPTGTLRITLRFNNPLSAGRYFAKITLPSGATAEYNLGM
jgi:hypothetical protein